MITTRYNWQVDRKRKVLFNQYGQILRDGPAWYFRGSYFDPDWAHVLLESPLGATGSLQTLIGDVESCIVRYAEVSRRRWYLRLLRVGSYTFFLVAVSVTILFAWARAVGY
jgi:hypothetical protein